MVYRWFPSTWCELQSKNWFRFNKIFNSLIFNHYLHPIVCIPSFISQNLYLIICINLSPIIYIYFQYIYIYIPFSPMNYLCIANQYAFLGRSHHLQKLNGTFETALPGYEWWWVTLSTEIIRSITFDALEHPTEKMQMDANGSNFQKQKNKKNFSPSSLRSLKKTKFWVPKEKKPTVGNHSFSMVGINPFKSIAELPNSSISASNSSAPDQLPQLSHAWMA